MGMYTEFGMSCKVKGTFHPIYTLINDRRYKDSNLEDRIVRCFPYDTHLRGFNFDIKGSIKNYEDEIDKFFKFMIQFIDEDFGTTVAWKLYENDTMPTIYIFMGDQSRMMKDPYRTIDLNEGSGRIVTQNLW